MPTNKELMDLARVLLDEEGRDEIEELLEDGNIEEAKICLLLALDSLVMENLIKESVAKKYYQILAFSPEEASRIRQLYLSGDL